MDVLVEDEPEPVPMTPPPRARVLPLAKTGPRGPVWAVETVATFMGRWPCRSQLWARRQKPGME